MGSIFRKGSEQSGQSGALSGEQAWMAKDLFNGTAGLRAAGIDRMRNFQETGNLPQQLRSTVGLGIPIAQQEAELANAKRGILDTMPRGGLQQRALMELPLQRLLQRDMFSANRAQIDDATKQNLFSTALNTGFGQGSAAMGQLGSAAGNLNSLGQQRIQQNQTGLQGAGQTIGKGLMAASKMCWIAERLYGVDDARTHILRAWFLSRPDWWVTQMYQRHGQWISRQWWCGALRPLFTYWLGRATTWAHSATV
jgi:hypothetical protein